MGFALAHITGDVDLFPNSGFTINTYKGVFKFVYLDHDVNYYELS